MDRQRFRVRFRAVAAAPLDRPLDIEYDGVCELTLEAADLEQMERFYRDVLGCRVLSRTSDRVWLACGSRTRLGLWLPGRKEFGDQGGRHVHFALSLSPERLDALCAHLERLGVEHNGPVTHTGGDRSLYVQDPAGNVVEFWDFFLRPEGAAAGVDALGER